MDNQNVFNVDSINDLKEHYNFLDPDPIGNTVGAEMMCLFNFLLKNAEYKAIEKLNQFPYTMIKRERPDFEITFSNNEKLMIEITAITTMKNEAILFELSKSKSSFAEVTQDIFSDVRPKKGEAKNKIKKSEEWFTEEGLYGYYPETQWARIVSNTIRKKAQKDYAKNVDILLLCNRLPSVYTNLHVGVDSFRENNSQNENRNNMPIFPFIVADSANSIVILRKDWKWEYKLLRRRMQ